MKLVKNFLFSNVHDYLCNNGLITDDKWKVVALLSSVFYGLCEG